MGELTWTTMGHEEAPGDQQADLFGGYWAIVGHDGRDPDNPWSWSILDFHYENAVEEDGTVPNEAAAKAAVQLWANDNEPADEGCATCQSSHGCRCDDLYEAFRDEQLGL